MADLLLHARTGTILTTIGQIPDVFTECLPSCDDVVGHVEFEEGEIANDTIDALAKKYIDQDRYPWNQPGAVRVNLRLNVERELVA